MTKLILLSTLEHPLIILRQIIAAAIVQAHQAPVVLEALEVSQVVAELVAVVSQVVKVSRIIKN